MTDVQTPPVGTDPVDEQPIVPSTVNAPETTENPSEEPAAPAAPDAAPEQPSPDPAPPEGYVLKDKFVASAQESILNAERVKVRDAQIEQLTNTDTPTDEAMRALYPEWDQLDDYNKRVIIRQETIAMQNARTLTQQQELSDRLKLEDELEAVIDGNSKLAGREAEFKRFAKNPKNRGINAETLAKAFLFDVEEAAPTPAAQPTNPQPMTEAMPAGNGGPRDDLTPKKISIEEAAEIRKTDYKRYKDLLDRDMIEEIE